MKRRSLCTSIFVLLALSTGLHAASTIYLASNFGPYKSIDGGASFTQLAVNVTNPFVGPGVHNAGSIAVDPKNSNNVYFLGDACYKSTDGGQTWSASTPLGITFLTGVAGLVIDPVATNVLYARANNGAANIVVKSVDSGVTWNPTATIPPPSDVPVVQVDTITIDPSSSGTLYVSGSGYLFKTTDFGNTWTTLTRFGNREITQVYVDPKHNQVLYGTSGFSFSTFDNCDASGKSGGHCAVFKSTDGGRSWIGVNIPGIVYATSVDFDEVTDAVYAAVDLNSLGVTLMKSTDSGGTWTPLSNKLDGREGLVVHTDPTAAIVYVLPITSDSNHFYKSTDGGANFTVVRAPAGCNGPIVQFCAGVVFVEDFAVGAGAAAPPSPTITVSAVQLHFSYLTNGALPSAQTISVTGGSFSWSASSDEPWLLLNESSAPGQVVSVLERVRARVNPQSLVAAPGVLTVSVNPAGLSAGPHTGHITITAAGATNSPLVIPVTLSVNAPVTGPTRTISHIANGASWRTTFILINTGTQFESFELKFWDDNGNPLVLDLGADGMTADLIDGIAPGVTRFIRTAGTGANLTPGWAELTSPLDIDGNSIFGLQTPGQGDSEAAVPLSPTGGTQLFIPFDYSTGYSTGIAFADPGPATANVTATILDDTGANVPAAGTITVHARGHHADVLAGPFPGVVGKRGVAHFTSTANIFGLGIRANGKAFTSIDALAGLTPATKNIPHIANGGGWKTTFLIVCTDIHASNFTLNFWHDNGTALTLPLGADGTVSTLTGTLQPGEVRIVQTTDTGSLVTGWAELTGLTGAIGGTAIFALQSPGQSDSEAAVPFATASSPLLFMPYDYSPGYSTAIAFANTGATQANITATFTDDSGNVLGHGLIQVPAHGHNAAVLGGAGGVLPAISGTRGTVSLTANVPVFGLGIRANGIAFTSLKVITK